MSQRADELAKRIHTFNQSLIDFVQHCSEAAWGRKCDAEEWTVGVVARHVADGHYRIIEMVKGLTRGEALPDLTRAQVIQMGNAHAAAHADCTREEVLALLTANGRAAAEYVARLSDEALDCKGHLALAGGAVTAQQLLEYVLLASGGEHLSSMQQAVAA